jgi:hypothetical protein
MRKMRAKTEHSFTITPVAQSTGGQAGLVYGRSGTGKTTFAATWPKPLLLLDVRERGTDSITNVEGVDVIQVESFDMLEEIYWMLAGGKHKYKTVVIDQLTQLQNLALEKALADRNKDPGDHVSKADFGNASGRMKTWLAHFRDLIDKDMNVLFLAHDRVFGDPDEDGEGQIDPSVGARLMPSVASDVNGAVKFIGNTFIRESFSIVNNKRQRLVEYCMRIGPHAYYTTKMRSPVGAATPETIVNPTFDQVASIMRGEYSEEATPSAVKRLVRRK